MILNHYTCKPFKFDGAKKYSPDPSEPNFKPVGLWLSDCSGDDGWKSWLEGQNWNVGSTKHKTSFKCDVKDWIVLGTTASLEAFTEMYKCEPRPEDKKWIRTVKFESIDWPRVMREKKGILITPYNWHCRHKYMWYYGWDCASACVWDLSTVELILEK